MADKLFALGDYLPKASEHNEQSEFFDWLPENYPGTQPLFFAVPNGAHLAGDKSQRARQMEMLKSEGFTPGVSDTLFLSGHGGYFGLALEFKTQDRKGEKYGGLTDGQRAFLKSVRREGYQSAVAYGAEDAEQIAGNYLRQNKTQDMIIEALECAERGDLWACKGILQNIIRVWR